MGRADLHGIKSQDIVNNIFLVIRLNKTKNVKILTIMEMRETGEIH